MLSWGVLVAILGIALLGWAWYASLAAREAANRIALETCERAGVQMLDGTVAILKLEPKRGASGTLTLRRTYVFDYTEDGFARRRGFVVMLGPDVETVGLGPRAVS